MATVFFSYSHKDEVLRDRLEVALSTLKRQGLIEGWHDRRIVVGDGLDGRISEQMERAEVILLLVSPDFIASDYCYDVEVRRAMERHEAGSARVIPVILRPCDWHPMPFGKLLAAPKDGKPVTTWPDEDTAMLDVSVSVRNALRTPAVLRAPTQPVGSEARSPAAPRSSNLSIRKSFTEADRDRFQDEGFDFMVRFFETSLDELRARNGGIQTSFKRVDANRFTAVVYLDGKAACRCSIHQGGMFGRGIAYANSDNPISNSINDSMSVEADDHGLFFKAMNMGFNRQASEHLTFEGAAEYYWASFIEPLQRRR